MDVHVQMKKCRAEREIELVRGSRQLGHAWNCEAGKMFAFLSIFHPDMPLKKRIALAAEQSDKRISPLR